MSQGSYFLPPGWVLAEHEELLTAADSNGRPLVLSVPWRPGDDTDVYLTRLQEAFQRTHEGLQVQTVTFLPGGMGPSIQLQGGGKSTDPLASLVQDYMSQDPFDPTATIEFLLAVEEL